MLNTEKDKKQNNPFGSINDTPPPPPKKIIDLGAIDRAEKASGYTPPKNITPKADKPPTRAKAPDKAKPVKAMTALQKRRAKKPKPVTERYTARLEPETILYFVDYSEQHGIPMREVLKRAAKALESSAGQGREPRIS